MTENGQLIARILNGDKNAYREFIRNYVRLVNHIVFKMVPNQTDREDLAQDIFVKIYQNLEGFKHESKISTWVGRIAYNTCLNFLEKKQVPLLDDVLPEDEPLEYIADTGVRPDETVEEKNMQEKLWAEIDALPVNYGVILALYHLQDMSYREISDVLNMPIGTVKNYIFRARKLLKDRLLNFNIGELCL